MDLINLTWHSEIKYLQPCISFPKYYWSNYTLKVYSEQKIFCHLVNEKAVHWLISLEGGVIIPSEVSNHLQSAQQLFSLTPKSTGETMQIFVALRASSANYGVWLRSLEQLAQVIKVKHLLAAIISWLLSLPDYWSQRSLSIHMQNAYK